MNFKFDGLDIDASTVACRELNFGQDRFNENLRPYKLNISKAELIQAFDTQYERWNKELKEDDELCKDEEPVELKRLEYPSLADMFNNHPKTLGVVILDYLGHEMLMSLLVGRDRNLIKYGLVTLDSVVVDCGIILFRGKAVDVSKHS